MTNISWLETLKKEAEEMDDRNERVNKMRNYRVLFPLTFVHCNHPIAVVNHVLDRCLSFFLRGNSKGTLWIQ